MNKNHQLERNIQISKEIILGRTFRSVGKAYDITYTRAQQIFRDTLERAIPFNTNPVLKKRDEWEYMFTKRVRAHPTHWNSLLRRLKHSLNS